MRLIVLHRKLLSRFDWYYGTDKRAYPIASEHDCKATAAWQAWRWGR